MRRTQVTISTSFLSVSLLGLIYDREVDVTFRVTPGRKGAPQTMDGPGEPDEGPEVEFVKAVCDNVEIADPQYRKYLPALVGRTWDQMEGDAVELAHEQWKDAHDAAQEDKADRIRDERRMK